MAFSMLLNLFLESYTVLVLDRAKSPERKKVTDNYNANTEEKTFSQINDPEYLPTKLFEKPPVE